LARAGCGANVAVEREAKLSSLVYSSGKGNCRLKSFIVARKRLFKPSFAVKADPAAMVNTDGWRRQDELVDVGFRRDYCV